MKIAILGYAGQGKAALDYWNDGKNQITICDQDPNIEVPADIDTKLGPDYLKNLGDFDLLIRTPAMHPNDIVAANPETPDILSKVSTVTNEFFKVCPTKNIIGVTGTKGKGTTSSLIARILEASGKSVHLGGNIGIPPLDMLKDNIQPTDWVVLELANFQLIDLQLSPKIAVCLMVVPEHLNWHADMDEYIVAKQQLFAHQTVHDLAIFNRNNAHSKDVVSVSPASKLSYEVPGPEAAPTSKTGAYLLGDTVYMNDVEICKTSDIALLGRHNIENVCAATAATWEIINRNPAIIKQVVSQFTGLEHRLELIRERNGIKYYDDSFGTTPETAIVAIQAFEQPKVVILGGASKGASFDDLAHVVASNNVRSAVLVGETAPDIEQSLKIAGFTSVIDGGQDMSSIMQAVQSVVQPGDIVLLSTGCASFGMFKNYKDRGEQFQTAVKSL